MTFRKTVEIRPAVPFSKDKQSQAEGKQHLLLLHSKLIPFISTLPKIAPSNLKNNKGKTTIKFVLVRKMYWIKQKNKILFYLWTQREYSNECISAMLTCSV